MMVRTKHKFSNQITLNSLRIIFGLMLFPAIISNMARSATTSCSNLKTVFADGMTVQEFEKVAAGLGSSPSASQVATTMCDMSSSLKRPVRFTISIGPALVGTSATTDGTMCRLSKFAFTGCDPQ
jgi:hypothetical protein